MLFPKIQTYFDSLDDRSISDERLNALNSLRNYVLEKSGHGEILNLTFICTHNSRRSHFGQVWAQIAAHEFGVENVRCFSGGTEATACNPRTVAALERAGLVAKREAQEENPVYELYFAETAPPVRAFSKLYDGLPNPDHGFAAVMTCSQAEQNCPYIPGAGRRFALPYSDPKEADDTPLESQVYDERCRQIATELKHLFRKLQF